VQLPVQVAVEPAWHSIVQAVSAPVQSRLQEASPSQTRVQPPPLQV